MQIKDLKNYISHITFVMIYVNNGVKIVFINNILLFIQIWNKDFLFLFQ